MIAQGVAIIGAGCVAMVMGRVHHGGPDSRMMIPPFDMRTKCDG